MEEAVDRLLTVNLPHNNQLGVDTSKIVSPGNEIANIVGDVSDVSENVYDVSENVYERCLDDMAKQLVHTVIKHRVSYLLTDDSVQAIIRVVQTVIKHKIGS